MKWVAGTLMVALIALVGFASESKALVGNKPTLQAGTFHTFTFNPDAGTTPYVCNTNSVSDPFTTTTSVITKGTVIYGMSVLAVTAGGVAGLYDEDDIHDLAAEGTKTQKVVDEIGEATQYDTAYTDWVAPIKLETGFCLLTWNNPDVRIYHD